MGNTSSKEEVNLLTKIGEGAYADVYKAVWKNKQVAAKKLHSYLLEKTDVKQKFKEEWELLSGLNHPNIVKYLTAVIPESPRESAIIVTELMEQDLRRFIMRSQTNPKVTFRDTVSIMLDVAKGLKYLHQLPTPVVHRDLACKNILLNATKRAKIADFGIAKCFPGGEMAATGNPGTLATRAPEAFGKWCFSRETKTYGTKADVFSFGVVLLEVIVGHPSVRISELHTEDGRIVPEAFRRSQDLYEVKPEHPLRPLVLQCLENNPDDRPTAHDLVDEVSVFKEENDFHRSQDNLQCRRPIHRIANGQYDYEFKVVMVGDQGVGKTSIATKFVRPNLPFQDRLPTTIAYGQYNERLQLKGNSILLQIVDTSGQFDTTSSLPQLYRGSHGAAVVFDVGSWDSLVSVRQWVSMVRERCGYDIPIILVGNKTDSEPREVNFETAENVSLEFNLFYIEVSAKTGVNIEETFCVLTEQLMQQRDLGSTSLSSPTTSAASSLPNSSPWRCEPPARITTGAQVLRKRIQRDPHGISFKLKSVRNAFLQALYPLPQLTEWMRRQRSLWDSSLSGVIKLGDKIGEGSYREVFKAVWCGKQVAAKRIRPIFFEGDHDGSIRAAFLEEFISEWKILRGLHHNNIVQYYTVILPPAPETPIIVTELLECDLAKYLRESESKPKVSFSEVIKLMLGIAKALHYLHSLEPSIVHRNLASRKILLTKSMDPKITGLDAAKAFTRHSLCTTAVPGMLPYAAPETYLKRFGRKPSYNEKIDIFSFGVLTLETIVGHLPNRALFDPVLEDGEIVPEYIRRSEDLEEMGPDHALHNLVLQCLETVPEDRPSAAEIIETLQKFSTIMEGKSSENELRKDYKMTMTMLKENRGSIEGTVNYEENELRKEFEKTRPTFKENQKSVEGIVNYEGGIVFAEDIQVICPNGAISQSDDHVVIKIVLEKPSTHCDMIVKNGLENEVMFIAPVLNLHPNGQVFKKPVILQTKLAIETDAFRPSDVLVLHGTQARDGKIVWADITHQAKIDSQKKELKVETNRFSRIAALLRLTSILAKNIITRLNFRGFHYTLSVLFKDNHPHSPLGELALVFMSHDVYHETCYREHPSSVLMQLKGNGYEEMCSIDRPEGNRIYSNENLKVSLSLGRDYEVTDGQLESIVEVDSSTWWSTGYVKTWSLTGADGVRILCGKIGIKGQYGHTLEETFCGLDTCEYVRRLLRVEGPILNLVPVARKLEVPEEAVNEAIKSWQKDEEQLKIILKHWSTGQEERCKDDPSMLRNTLQELNSKDCEVDERGKMHINHLRELAFEIQSLNRKDQHLMEYFLNQIRTICRDFILKDCCIELDADVSVENYPHFLSIRQKVTEDVALKLETICSSSTTSITEDFLSIVPFLIQAIKGIFRKENHQIVQNGLRGLPKESVSQHESKVRDAFLNKDIFRFVYEVCEVLESLCLNNCDKHSTEEIESWGESLAILNLSEFLKKFFQSRQDGKLHKRLQLFSRSLKRISKDVHKIKEIEMRYVYNVALNLIKFATFDPSKLVRFEITDSTNSSVTCYSEVIKYDRPHDTFSQQFEIRKGSKDKLQLGATARVHLDGRIRNVGAFESVIVLPSSSGEELDRFPISTLPVAVRTERTDSGDLRVVLSSTRKKSISEALCVLQRELVDDIVDKGQVEITESHLKLCCFFETVGLVRLRLLYKWRSEAISVDSKDFVAIGESPAIDLSTSASDSGLSVANSSSPLEAEVAALSVASRSVDNDGNFVMDPSAIELIETHARQKCGRLELHLHQTIQNGHVCVTGNSTSLHMDAPKTAQRFIQAGLCAPSQKSITAGASSSEGAVSEPQKNQSIDTEERED